MEPFWNQRPFSPVQCWRPLKNLYSLTLSFPFFLFFFLRIPGDYNSSLCDVIILHLVNVLYPGGFMVWFWISSVLACSMYPTKKLLGLGYFWEWCGLNGFELIHVNFSFQFEINFSYRIMSPTVCREQRKSGRDDQALCLVFYTC